MLLSSAEIKSQLLQQSEATVRPTLTPEKKSNYIEIGTAVKRMTGTKGWKIVEAWLLRQLDVGSILTAKPEVLPILQAQAQAFAKIIQQVNWWVTMAEQLEKEDKAKDSTNN